MVFFGFQVLDSWNQLGMGAELPSTSVILIMAESFFIDSGV